jgi:hypothetical protein
LQVILRLSSAAWVAGGATDAHLQEERPLAATKTLEKILRGTSDANIFFDDLRRVLQGLGFSERVRGNYHIFSRDGVDEILNLHPRGNKAISYQVKQVRQVILKYRMGGELNAKTEV